jgi:TetR/AcrR family tetracycline transcriptional repressor
MARDGERTGKKQTHLQREKIVQVALSLLNEVGLDGLTMRRLADHLEVQVAALYWHFKNKQELLNAMAEVMITDCKDDIPDSEDWGEHLQGFMQNLRAVLLAYRDGARVFAGAYTTGYNTLRCAELLTSTVSQAGYPLSSVFGALWTLVYYVLGFTIEEQSFLSSPEGNYSISQEALTDSPFPTLARLQPFFENRDFDAHFKYGLNLIIEGLRKEKEDLIKKAL